jgi:putative intracellular protease/amidase
MRKTALLLAALLTAGLAQAAAPLPAVEHISPWQDRFARGRPLVAVVAENYYTELTDYVVPYGVLKASGVADVMALATKPEPVRLFPAFHVQAEASTADFDRRYPQGADYVIVPAVHRTADPTLLAWVRAQAAKGATVVGVCDGVWVLANAGLLKGHRATGHWYSLGDLGKKFPDTQWRHDSRYVADGNIVTTTGVTASMPVSLALVEAIAGTAKAKALAQQLGVADWSTHHNSDAFHLSSPHMMTAARNTIAFWRHERIGQPLTNGVDELALALSADAWSRTYQSSVYALAPTMAPVTTRHGLVLLPDGVSGTFRTNYLLPALDASPAQQALEHSLSAIAARDGDDTAAFVALQMEYPWQQFAAD